MMRAYTSGFGDGGVEEGVSELIDGPF